MRLGGPVRLLAGLLALLSVVVWLACHKHGTAPLALEECDPAGYIPCIQQTAFLSIPITDTNLFLTYSSRWSSKQPAWDAAPLGLGGWSVNLVERYDRGSRVLVSGDGSWRLTDSLGLPSGEFAVPSYDGTLAYVFDTAGRHVRTMDAHMGMELVKIGYDSAGRLTSVTGFVDSEPVHVSIERDANGRARALVGIDGGTTRLRVDDRGQLASFADPADATTLIVWNPAGSVESETDPAGNVSRFTYGDSGILTSATDADGVIRRFERSTGSSSLEIRVATALGRHWSYRAESTGNSIRRTFTAPDGTASTETVASDGVREIDLADGTKFTVGALAGSVWKMASPILTPVVENRPDGVTSRREIKYGLTAQRGLPYILAGSITTLVNGQAWVQAFAPTQRMVTLVDPEGRRTDLSYDDQGRILSYSAPGMAPVYYTYNAEGRRVSETVGTGKLARTTRYSYDANTGQIIITRPDGINEKTSVDKSGRTVSITAGDGSTVLAGYDAAGRIAQIQPPGGLNFTLGNSAAGRPTAFVPPMVGNDGSAETRSYDADGNLEAISGLGGRSVSLGYDSGGRVTSRAFDQGKRTASYDSHTGLISEATDPSGIRTSYGFVGRLSTGLKWSGPVNGSVAITHDANGRVSRETVNGSSNLDFKYDGAGDLAGIGSLALTRDPQSGLVTHTDIGAVETKQEFDENRQLIRMTATAAAKLLLDQRYLRDALGRIKSVVETDTDGKTTTTEYSYDRADRLAWVRVNGRLTETNNYDPAGNRVSLVRARENLKATYDDRDRLVSLGNTQYKWMPDGSLAGVAQGQHASAFVYDDFGALRQASLADGRKIEYLVDADGRRVGRKVGDKLVAGYLYRPDGSIAAETDGSGKVTSRFGYDDSGHLALVERGAATYRVITDQLGSPRLILDSLSGAVVERINYDAWGKVTEDTAPGFITLNFAGGLRDPDTGLVRFGARDYDPRVGRWTAGDPLRFNAGDTNLYRYTGGDPVNRTDVNGLDWFPHPVPGGLCTDSGRCWFAPPPGHLPPPPSNPPTPGGAPWSCSGLDCQGPGGGCAVGTCGTGPNGFWCTALQCSGPGRSCAVCSMGDPHLLNAFGTRFDFQAAGEFLAAFSSDGKLVIQTRQEPVLGGTEIAFNTAVAANINGDRVGVYAEEPQFLLVNRSPLDQPDVEKRLPHGGILQLHGATVNLRWPDGTRLNIIRLGRALNYGIIPPPNSNLALSGLLGNSGKTDELVERDGAVLSRSDPAFQTKLYRQFGNSWRIKQSESLFHYWPGESTLTFTNLNIPSREIRSNSLAPETRSKAEQICRAVGVHDQPALDDCILDVGVTGMPAFAAASVGIGANPAVPSRAPGGSATANNAPVPNVPATQLPPADRYDIKIGDTVSPDHPAKTAGIISTLGQKQSYVFSGRAGDAVYVAVGPCEGAIPTLWVLEPDNSVLNSGHTRGDIGRVDLPVNGAYRIVAETDKSNVFSRYSFSLQSVFPDQHFSVQFPITVSPGLPVSDAGRISAQGAQQFYDFTAAAGTTVHIESKCAGSCPKLALRVIRADDHLGFDYGSLDLNYLKYDWTLPPGGRYTIQVRSNGYVGDYAFMASEVNPPHR